MHKGAAVSIVIVFILASGTFAANVQEQGFNITTSNTGALTGSGIGSISSINFVPLTNIQQTVDDSGNIQYVQVGVSSLYQGASSSGMLGVYGFNQGALAVGNQWQESPDYFILGLQDQDLGTAFTQDVFTIGGLGSAAAIQHFVGNQNQFIVTPYGVSANVQILGIGLLDGVDSHIVSLISRGLSVEHVSRLRY